MMFSYLQQAFRRRPPRPSLTAEIDFNRASDFLAMALRCRTQNEFNRLRITLENILAPAEIAAIATLDLPPETAERTRHWFDKLSKWRPDMLEAPQGYARQHLSPRLIFYRDTRVEPREKDLLVTFSGNTGRLMMPVSVFLQFMDSKSWDIALLKKPASGSHLRGVDKNADNFPGLVQFIETALRPRAYRRVMTLGASSGGFPALWAAALMGADRGISAGGCPPRTLPDLRLDDRGPRADFCMVYSAGSTQDSEAALVLKDLFGGRLHPVADIEGHNVLSELMRRGQLAEFLKDVLV